MRAREQTRGRPRGVTSLRGEDHSSGVPLSPERIDAFLKVLQARGRTEGTLEWYRRGLEQLYEALPADKQIRRDTLELWRQALLNAGYAARTVNLYLSVANSFLTYAGERNLQMMGRLAAEREAGPELSREEYVRLLQTAKALERERVYLLVKLFVSTGLPLQELSGVTVEAVKDGGLTVRSGGGRQTVRIPEELGQELLSYAAREGHGSGPVFLDRDGKPMSRNNVTNGVKQLCQAAGVPEEKGSPRCLRRLYQSTREELETRAARWVDQAMDRILLREQKAVAWEN